MADQKGMRIIQKEGSFSFIVLYYMYHFWLSITGLVTLVVSFHGLNKQCISSDYLLMYVAIVLDFAGFAYHFWRAKRGPHSSSSKYFPYEVDILLILHLPLYAHYTSCGYVIRWDSLRHRSL